ncbi:hypothetical protein SODALDRAFT_332305 [Sodiomyces alkalinus F11]|uniref:CNH domain-containing protein n=1 Tax=Sodiomyces alkalinus (strain CBS 110278 / VKM F-3762 / F11) TaxID=1314773 RepID=A0A3N2Q074_SODAK|nr:hypothetical protein SODALDRAFT_332305 [Sodiomyces alkalinus F11]ROT40142.1 hypothetical protein SODALDRAFT_332305 [Sodiomyces alkalinus F11]
MSANTETSSEGKPFEDGPYILRTLLKDVPLSADGADNGTKINCVEYFDHNLYIGTNAAELLHYVHIPPDANHMTAKQTFILASRLQPPFSESSTTRPGVQQILLLPKVSKACVLCNWTVTFYSLPELSPVFGTKQVKNCNWVGGVDLNESREGSDASSAVTILLSLNRRIQVVRVGDDATAVKKIDIGESIVSVRRDSIACVADSRSYALLDIDRQLKIPLMSISSVDDFQQSSSIGRALDVTGSHDAAISRSASAAQNRRFLSPSDSHGHTRSTSLGGAVSSGIQDNNLKPSDIHRLSQDSTADKPLPGLPDSTTTDLPHCDVPARPRPRPVFLKPHIVSPTPEEFLVVTGTGPSEPGIGLFVNLDGDPTRPTIQFDRYPRDVVVDEGLSDSRTQYPAPTDGDDGYIIASMTKSSGGALHHGLEIQRWTSEVAGTEPSKFWLEADDTSTALGIGSVSEWGETFFREVVDGLRQTRFSLFALDNSTLLRKTGDSDINTSLDQVIGERKLFDRDTDTQSDDGSLSEGWEFRRNAEEEGYASRFARAYSRLAVWSGNRIWWATRKPLLLRLDAQLDAAYAHGHDSSPLSIDRRAVLRVLKLIRGRDARSEVEFVSLSYIRQKAGIMLLDDFLNPSGTPFSDTEVKALEEVLAESSLDARVVISLIPGLRNEVVESRKGIWVFDGVKKTAEQHLRRNTFEQGKMPFSTLDTSIFQFLRRFLSSWRKKKGFGSVPDDREVFRTVDAALLTVLLELDRRSPVSHVRAELYEMVDKGVDCFDRAISLLESYHRLFVLSRLYQSRKMAGDVLGTWRRIIEGERDDGGEFRDGEARVRDYLTKVSSQPLVREYGIWLANRNPKLGVQAFAEDEGRAPKYAPAEAITILRDEAPSAVKYYLEHLVFGKGQTAFVQDLITYYLDIIIGELRSSETSRETFAATYVAYRALQTPKPTYQQFLTDNAPAYNEVWQGRLRLLQLLSGTCEYDTSAIRERISSLPDELLVPETIILDGREQHHENAIRLLVHKLGDYDTAISYCIRGGSSIYARSSQKRDSMPTHQMQARLFRAVLGEFLSIEDVSDRVEQTKSLLERFGGWFELDDVLALIPDNWSASVVSGFLVRCVRRLVQERHVSSVKKGLSSAENLRVGFDLICRVEERGPSIQTSQCDL